MSTSPHFANTRKRKSKITNSIQQDKKLRKTKKLNKDFFNVPCSTLANNLLDAILVRRLSNGKILKARIVETESYLGGDDKASKSFGGRRTPGNEPMYMDPGTAYVYMTYGMYFCFNISSAEPGAAVLLRALEPLEGLEIMQELRMGKMKSKKQLKPNELCNGPSKLCMSMDIDKNKCNTIDMSESDSLWLEKNYSVENNFKIISSTRIGIESVGQPWASKLLRYYVLGSDHVSKRDKNAEASVCDEGRCEWSEQVMQWVKSM